MDKRKLNGGKREGSGIKPKDEELKLVEKLTPLEPLAFEALKKGLEKGDFKYVQLLRHFNSTPLKKFYLKAILHFLFHHFLLLKF